jgi:hypothetical protein
VEDGARSGAVGWRRDEVRGLRSHRRVGAGGRAAVRGAAGADRELRARRVPRLPRRRAPQHAARARAFAERLPRRGDAAHDDAAPRPARLLPAALPPAAAHRRGLHARSAQRRAVAARRRGGGLAGRGRFPRRRLGQPARALRRGVRDPARRAELRGAHPSRRVLRLRRGADEHGARPAPAPAAVVRDLAPGARGVGGRARGQRRRAAARADGQAHHRRLPAGVGGARPGRRRHPVHGRLAARRRRRERGPGDGHGPPRLPTVVSEPQPPLAQVRRAVAARRRPPGGLRRLARRRRRLRRDARPGARLHRRSGPGRRHQLLLR